MAMAMLAMLATLSRVSTVVMLSWLLSLYRFPPFIPQILLHRILLVLSVVRDVSFATAIGSFLFNLIQYDQRR